MRLIRFGEKGQEQPGVEINGRRFSVANHFNDYDEQFFSNGGLEKLAEIVKTQGESLPAVDNSVRLGSPVARPSKIICIGLNYAKHAEETGADIPKEPVVFFKATTALTGPFDTITIPRGSMKTDWEVELAVVIGKKTSYITPEQADEHIAGYCLHNDVSERAYQLERGGQWVKGKSCDTFAPIGPYLVTKDEGLDPHNLRLWLKVNGEMMQDSNTNDFIFNIPHVIAYLSEFMTLLPGDIISTGTPAGVGLGQNPPKYLADGDVVELGIEGLGESRQVCTSYKG